MMNRYIMIMLLALPVSALAGINADDAMVCKAAVASLMQKDPDIISIDKAHEGILYLSYVRPGDYSKWSLKCRIEQDRVVWGKVGGRWRTHGLDSVLTYLFDGDSIRITETFSDGNALEHQFKLTDLE